MSLVLEAKVLTTNQHTFNNLTTSCWQKLNVKKTDGKNSKKTLLGFEPPNYRMIARTPTNHALWTFHNNNMKFPYINKVIKNVNLIISLFQHFYWLLEAWVYFKCINSFSTPIWTFSMLAKGQFWFFHQKFQSEK